MVDTGFVFSLAVVSRLSRLGFEDLHLILQHAAVWFGYSTSRWIDLFLDVDRLFSGTPAVRVAGMLLCLGFH